VFPRVSIIILNWNGWRDTIECLESLYRITYANYDVIVVDNGSQDDSVQKIKEYAKGKIRVDSKFFEYNPNNKPIKVFEISENEAREGKFNRSLYKKFDVDRRMILIKNKDNYGFAGGNNIGIKFALSVLNPDYVLLLNNDTIVDPNFLSELVKVAESNEKIGIVGSKIYYYSNPDILWHAGGKMNMWLGKRSMRGYRKRDGPEYELSSNVDFVAGAALLITVKTILEIDLLDTTYFVYTEDIDWCYRATKGGYNVVYVPTAKVWHKVSISSGGEMSPTSLYYITRNTLLFMKKHAKVYQWVTYVIFSGFLFLRRFLLVDLNGKKALIKGIVEHLRK